MTRERDPMLLAGLATALVLMLAIALFAIWTA